MTAATKRPEPTFDQLHAALARLHAAAPKIWPEKLHELGANAAKLVRARALQAMGETDLRDRDQIPIACALPGGGFRTVFVAGDRTPQLALSEEFKR